ncbi:MAG: hypothetical protein GTO48_03730, partial [Xanthomonadales bacterium]|nr:hypothetical protein [Xanthomonadales bacterium]
WQDELAGKAAADAEHEGKRERVWADALRLGGSFHERKATSFPELNRSLAGKLAEDTPRSGQYELVIHPHHAIYD